MFVRTNDGRVFSVIEHEGAPQAFLGTPAYKAGTLWVKLKGFNPRLVRKAGCEHIADSNGIPFAKPRNI